METSKLSFPVKVGVIECSERHGHCTVSTLVTVNNHSIATSSAPR